jgi:hypothetical protein
MAWNRSASILGTGTTAQDVEKEADTILTALFVGLAFWKALKGQGLRLVSMEPEMEINKDRLPEENQKTRTDKDRDSMKRLNRLCAKVNHLVRSYERINEERKGVCAGLRSIVSRQSRNSPEHVGTLVVAGMTRPRGARCRGTMVSRRNLVSGMTSIRGRHSRGEKAARREPMTSHGLPGGAVVRQHEYLTLQALQLCECEINSAFPPNPKAAHLPN